MKPLAGWCAPLDVSRYMKAQRAEQDERDREAERKRRQRRKLYRKNRAAILKRKRAYYRENWKAINVRQYERKKVRNAALR